VRKPTITGKDVPSARNRSKDEVSPGKSQWARVEKKKADSPKPERTKPTVVAR